MASMRPGAVSTTDREPYPGTMWIKEFDTGYSTILPHGLDGYGISWRPLKRVEVEIPNAVDLFSNVTPKAQGFRSW